MTDSDLRLRIYNAIASTGPATAAELSRFLQITDRRLDYHLRRLADEGWIAEDAESFTTARPFHDNVLLPDHVVEAFRDAQVEAGEGLYGEATVSGGEHRARISHAQAEEFRGRLYELVGEYFAPGAGDRAAGFKYGFAWALVPIDLPPYDDQP